MTIHKFGPEDAATFTLGESVTIDELRYETACAIFGQPVVDAYYEYKRNPPKAPPGRCTVTAIDRKSGTITFGPVEPSEGDPG